MSHVYHLVMILFTALIILSCVIASDTETEGQPYALSVNAILAMNLFLVVVLIIIIVTLF